LAGLVDLFQGFVQKIEAVPGRPPQPREPRSLPKIRSKRHGAEIHEGRHALAQDFDPAGNVGPADSTQPR